MTVVGTPLSLLCHVGNNLGHDLGEGRQPSWPPSQGWRCATSTGTSGTWRCHPASLTSMSARRAPRDMHCETARFRLPAPPACRCEGATWRELLVGRAAGLGWPGPCLGAPCRTLPRRGARTTTLATGPRATGAAASQPASRRLAPAR